MSKSNDNSCQKLTDRRFKVIPVILGAKSVSDGCKSAKISRETFYQYLKDPVFKAEFVNQRREIIDIALHELKSAAGEAVAVLKKLLGAKQEHVRLKTALGLLEHISNFIRYEDLELRMSEIERSQKK